VVLCLLYVVSLLAFGEAAWVGADNAGDQGLADFFKTTYKASGPTNYVVWRAIAVPIFTAADTLRVFAERFGGEPLWGATSSFLAAIFSQDRVVLEKFVYEYQFGWNELANANAVFFAEAFANFHWYGVVLFSMFVGQSLRWFRKSDDIAFKALWMNYCFALSIAGLIGTMLSNGYSLIFFLALFCSLRTTKQVQPVTHALAGQT
jgi:hypothetical protein